MLDRLLHRGLAQKHRQETYGILQTEQLSHLRIAEVTVKEEHTVTDLRDADRQIGRGDGLALIGNGARDDDRLSPGVEIEELQIGP